MARAVRGDPVPDPTAAPPEPAAGYPTGYIDFYGSSHDAGGWFFCGWVAERWPESLVPDVSALFEAGKVLTGRWASAFFQRSDLGDGGLGIVLFVPARTYVGSPLRHLTIDAGGRVFRLLLASRDRLLGQAELRTRLQPILERAYPGHGRTDLLAVLARRGFSGLDTLPTLSGPVRAGVDEVIACPEGGAVLCGWMLAAPGMVRSIELRCGELSTPVDLAAAVRVERDDVVDSFRDLGLAERRCGFVTYLPRALLPSQQAYLEVETVYGELGHLPLPAPKLRGVAAIRRLLGAFEARYTELPRAFALLGPAVAALNRERLAERPAVLITAFGAAPAGGPVHSIIVPLHGRLDFMEYQLAFFSRDADRARFDLIYVLDDPDRQREAEHLADSAYARFGVPFRLAVLGRNLGYAPANNVGLGLARGAHVCFLNSDVFPEAPGWLGQLAGRLDADPGLGAVGPLLLFEDGSVQHQGMVFAPLAQFGGWQFPQHPRKGWRPDAQRGLVPAEAITGACLVMRTADARALGGFDEDYVIGDFEDTDLCLRLRRRGLGCAVDHDVRLFHLERKSQGTPGDTWRMNLTLHNAWTHQSRWFDGAPAVEAAPRRVGRGGA